MNSLGLKNENIYGHKKRLKFILEIINQLKDKKNLRILDFGCGTGETLTLPIAEQNYYITGIDFDEKSIQRAKNVNPFNNATFICTDLLRYQSCESYDVIICSEVLEHLINPEAILIALKKMLKPEGIMIITIPNGYGPFEIEQLGLKILIKLIPSLNKVKNKIMLKDNEENGVVMTENVDSPHIQFFSREKFQNLIHSSGFKIEKSANSSVFAGPFSSQLFKYFPRIIYYNVEVLPKSLPYQVCSAWYFVLKQI